MEYAINRCYVVINARILATTAVADAMKAWKLAADAEERK
jgi:hypothetical protein